MDEIEEIGEEDKLLLAERYVPEFSQHRHIRVCRAVELEETEIAAQVPDHRDWTWLIENSRNSRTLSSMSDVQDAKHEREARARSSSGIVRSL
jgi:hypothetical protein